MAHPPQQSPSDLGAAGSSLRKCSGIERLSGEGLWKEWARV